jgi:hypothetical protein
MPNLINLMMGNYCGDLLVPESREQPNGQFFEVCLREALENHDFYDFAS